MDTYKDGFIFTDCKDVKGRTRDCWFKYKDKYRVVGEHSFLNGQTVEKGVHYKLEFKGWETLDGGSKTEKVAIPYNPLECNEFESTVNSLYKKGKL